VSVEAGQRYDLSRLAKVKDRTPSGGARIPANFTRAGIFEYRRDGSVQLEFRSPEEVFKTDSLATLRDAPVLEGHPAMVDPSNWAKYTRGHVSGDARQDGNFVAGLLAIQDGATLTRIDRGDGSELSCGYACKTRPWSGEWDGKRYDNIVEQYDIAYNHVGIGGVGWGRAGKDVALRLDGGVCEHFDTSGDAPQKAPKMLVRFDGKDYEAGSPELVTAIWTRHDALVTELATAVTARDTLDGELATTKTQLAKAQSDLTAANDPTRLDSAIAERVTLVTAAAKVLGEEYKFDGKTALEIQTAVIAVSDPEVKLDGKSADFIAGAFAGACRSGKRADSIDQVPEVLARVTASKRTDTKADEDKARRAKAQAEQRTPHFDSDKLREGK
jgi:hypothetical protein